MTEQSSGYRLALKSVITLAQDVQNHPEAKAQFSELREELSQQNAEMAELLQILWDEYVTLQRSAAFWRGMSDAEKELSDKITETNIQLQQNYNRLMQEQ